MNLAFLSPIPTTTAHATLTLRRPSVCMTAAPEGNQTKSDQKSADGAETPPPPPPPSQKSSSKPVGSSKPQKTIRSSAGWGTRFFPGFGRKGPGSDPGWDLRPKSFRGEEAKEGCANCRGSGVMTCSFCMGGDFQDGKGNAIDCPACFGQKEVTCSVCFGSKKQIELLGNWWERGVNGLFN